MICGFSVAYGLVDKHSRSAVCVSWHRYVAQERGEMTSLARSILNWDPTSKYLSADKFGDRIRHLKLK